ncbi:phospholipase D family protein [Sorangium sp. So ce406]|uniref:phospholipase D family protein n=1 Tax=Sorangium sp. So ce406 TaxID=3133311 RepID=UPI003F5C20FC
MIFRLVDHAWDKEIDSGLAADHSAVRIVCPFIKRRTAARLLAHGRPETLQVITRFDLDDFSAGVSDILALRSLLEHGGRIRGLRNLHAKLYVFGQSRAIVTSANLTEAAMAHNHELGVVAEGKDLVDPCLSYFDRLWGRSGEDLNLARLESWEAKVTKHQAEGARADPASRLGDEGADGGLLAVAPRGEPWSGDAEQSFVKLFGEGDNRAFWTMPVFTEVDRSGSHRACTYPKGKRPRKAQDGAIMFMGRMVQEPNDILIYGRAIALAHMPQRDDATPADIARRSWKKDWPHYVRVHHAEFVDGTLANGVSLNALMEALESDAFRVTQEHARRGEGNTNPRHAYRQQPQVELSREGFAWMSAALDRAFAEHGKLSPEILAKLDWPSLASEHPASSSAGTPGG